MTFLRPTVFILLMLSASAVRAEDAGVVKKAAVMQHAKIIHASYADSLAAAQRMRSVVGDFLSAPDAAKLEAAREAWTLARQPFLQTEAYRFYSGPIDDADGPEQLLNAWPRDENFIEAVPGGAEPGIVGNTRDFPQITPQVLELVNQRDGEKCIACGWHAIEFLLWGQDKSAAGPGARPFTDYTSAPFAARRGQLLKACVDLVILQLKALAEDWRPEDINKYRAYFEEATDTSVENMLSALIFLSENELAGARLQVAYDTKDQENEHSCFSDTTWQDNVYNAMGIQNVWRGTYVRTDGSRVEGLGLRDIFRALKPEMEAKVTELIGASVAKARAIPQPFDQAILGGDESPGRSAVMALITALEDQAVALRTLAQELGISVPDVPPGGLEG